MSHRFNPYLGHLLLFGDLVDHNVRIIRVGAEGVDKIHKEAKKT